MSRGMGQPIAAIEIKSSVSPENKELSGFNAFAEDYPKTPRFCFCRTPHGYSKNGIEFVAYKQGLDLLATF